ncbi:MAG: stalk domain-containing protein [Defluviitaleaceae bacterium]|nr:stalk domain-containing protein [Defluviitaleaceae bacterium]
MKKMLCMVLSLVLALGAFTITTFANTINVTLNGTPVEFDVPPQMIDNRTMVPLRPIFEALGADIDWNGDTQTVTATRNGTVVVMQVGNPVITVDGNNVTLDVAPVIIDGRTLVPARAVAESFGVSVDWDGNTQTVILTVGNATTPPTSGSPLVGRWVGYEQHSPDIIYTFTFNPDGTGFREITQSVFEWDDYAVFTWLIEGNIVRIGYFGDSPLENDGYYFTIIDDVLTLDEVWILGTHYWILTRIQ